MTRRGITFFQMKSATLLTDWLFHLTGWHPRLLQLIHVVQSLPKFVVWFYSRGRGIFGLVDGAPCDWHDCSDSKLILFSGIRSRIWMPWIKHPWSIANHDTQPVATCSQVLGISPPSPVYRCVGSVACCIYIISVPWLVWSSFHSCGCSYTILWKCWIQIGHIRHSLLCIHILLRHENLSRPSSRVCDPGHWLN